MRDSIIFYRSFYEAISQLPLEMQGKVYSAIFEYSLNFNEIILEGLPKAIFTLIKPQLEANNRRYENGSKGGRKKQKETKTEPKRNQKETKIEANDNDNDNDNDNNNNNSIVISSVDFKSLAEYWNLSFKNKNIPKIDKMTPKRKKAVNTIVKEFGKEKIKEAVSMILNNEFFNGGSDNGWILTFDWLFTTGNFTKVIEGNYNRNKTTINNNAIY